MQLAKKAQETEFLEPSKYRLEDLNLHSQRELDFEITRSPVSRTNLSKVLLDDSGKKVVGFLIAIDEKTRYIG